MCTANERQRYITKMPNWQVVSQKTREMCYEVYGDMPGMYDIRVCLFLKYI